MGRIAKTASKGLSYSPIFLELVISKSGVAGWVASEFEAEHYGRAYFGGILGGVLIMVFMGCVTVLMSILSTMVLLLILALIVVPISVLSQQFSNLITMAVIVVYVLAMGLFWIALTLQAETRFYQNINTEQNTLEQNDSPTDASDTSSKPPFYEE